MKIEYKVIIFVVVIIAIFLFINNKSEHLDATVPLSNEAIQNIASVYADTKGTNAFNNITVTGKIKSPNGKFSFAMQDDGNLAIYDDTGKQVWSRMDSTLYSPNRKIRFEVQDDANILVRQNEGNVVKWDRSRQLSFPDGKYMMNLQEDGKLVIYDTVKFDTKWASDWHPTRLDSPGRNYSIVVNDTDGKPITRSKYEMRSVKT